MYGGVVRIEAHASPSLSRDQLWGCLGVSELYFLAELFCPSTAALWDGGLLTNDTLHPSHALPLSAILVLSTLYIAYTKYRYVLPLQPLAFSESVRPLRNVIYWEAWIDAWKMNKRHTYTKGSPALWSSLSMVYNKAKWLLKTRKNLWKNQTLSFFPWSKCYVYSCVISYILFYVLRRLLEWKRINIKIGLLTIFD